MRSNGHYSNGLPVGGFLRGVPFWLGAVVVSFVPDKNSFDDRILACSIAGCWKPNP